VGVGGKTSDSSALEWQKKPLLIAGFLSLSSFTGNLHFLPERYCPFIMCLKIGPDLQLAGRTKVLKSINQRGGECK
jgi:hypothetical protein